MITSFNNKKELRSLLETEDGRNIAVQVTFLNSLRQKLEHKKNHLKENDPDFHELEVDIQKIDSCIAMLEQQTFAPKQH